jgi:uncharacterized protein YecE (DUF72 family)
MPGEECVRVGCQGWNYDDWITGPASADKIFYPQGTRPAAMLDLYARAFETVEVDSTFYAIPSAQTIEGWKRRTPERFSFALKLPQEITHARALRDGSPALLAEFSARARLLDDKLAAVLIQLPPQFLPSLENKEALREFVPHLPRDMRFAIEFRDTNWLRQRGLAEFLRGYNVALALVEGPWLRRERVLRWAAAEEPTADFAYLRWMGERDLTRFDTTQRAQDQNLRDWSGIAAALCRKLPHVFAYFSNYYEGHAPASANKLKRMLGQPVKEARDLEDQPSLF